MGISSKVTNSDSFHRIYPNQKGEIEAFEKAFYQAFILIEKNILIRKIWDWDDASKKLRMKMSYDDLVILCWKSEKNSILCGVAANENNAFTQINQFGFYFPDDRPKPHCEIVTLFTQMNDRRCGIRLNQHFLKPYCIKFMYDLGYKSLYSTCSEKPLMTYLRWGWEKIDEKLIGTEKRYFLYYNIESNLAEA